MGTFMDFESFVNEQLILTEKIHKAPSGGFSKDFIEKVLKKSKDLEIVSNNKQYYITPFHHKNGSLLDGDDTYLFAIGQEGDKYQIAYKDIDYIEEGICLDSLNYLNARNLVSESRPQIKRKYGIYSAKRVNKKAPMRNNIIKHIGDINKPMTESDLDNVLLRVSEDLGKPMNKKRWFESNKHFFKWSKVDGVKCCQLSTYGKRVYDSIVRDGISTKKITRKLNESV